MAVILLSFIQATLQGGGTMQGGTKVQTPTTATLQSISIAPSTNTLAVGSTYTLVATGVFSDGSSSNVTALCAWTSSNTAVATVAASGSPRTITAVGVGSSSITCVMQGVTGTAQVTVVNVISVSPGAVPAGIDGQPYSVTFTASGATAPYHFSITNGLAALQGIGLNFSAPTLSGTLTATSVGSYGFTLTVTDSASPPNTTVQNYVLTVNSSTGPSRIATLPQVWANPHEADLPNPCDVAHNCYIKRIKTDGSGDFPCTKAGLQASMDQWAATPLNVWWHVIIDDGLSTDGQCIISSTTAIGWTWKAKTTGTALPTGFIVYESEHPNAVGRTVCNHMQAISLVTSVRNPSCNTNPNISDLDHMWKFTSSGTTGYGGQLITGVGQMNSGGYGPSHIVLRDVELETTGAATMAVFINTCGGSAGCPVNPLTLNASVSHIGIERIYGHGDWIVPATGPLRSASGTGQQMNFVIAACTECWFEWNYFDRITGGAATEGKVFGLGNAKPGVKVAHNWIEGGEIGTLVGGGGGTDLGGPPTDVEIRANVWTRDPAWLTSASAGTGNPTGWKDCRFPMKNAMELKEAIRFLINGNILENSRACSQDGQGMTVNIRACSGGALCNNFRAQDADITFTNNVTRNTENDVESSARSSLPGSGSTVASPGRRWNFQNNLTYNMALRVPGNTTTRVWQSGDQNGHTWTQCTGSRDSAGAISTVTCKSTNPPWNGQLVLSVGDPFNLKGCTPADFNTPVGMGPPVLPGTTGLTVVYANPGPANEQLTSSCTLRVNQGAPFESTWIHNTNIWNGGGVNFPWILGSNPPTGQPASYYGTFARGNTYRDSILSPSSGTSWNGPRSSGASGTTAMAVGFDMSTLIFGHMLMTGNMANQFTASGTGQAGTIWSPPTAGIVCTGATADSTCVGYNGYMNGAAWVADPVTIGQDPLVFFALHPTSLYKSGNSRQASDGKDMGADMNAIRNAMSETEYSGCAPGACGPTGPYPD